MVVFSNCKINLGLRILKRREDGYHEVETVMYPLPLYDILEVLPSDSFKFLQTGLVVDGSQEDNMCVKAYRLFQKAFGIGPVYMHLHKQLPIGAGMGGGSANGTFVLKVLNTLFQLNLEEADLQFWSAKLGSDCPFFVKNTPQLARGRGEILEEIPVSLKGRFLVIEKPDIVISTGFAFQDVHISGISNELVNHLRQPLETWKTFVKNDFENHIFEKYPELRQIKDLFYKKGALYASLTGSGAVVYAIFNHRPEGFKTIIEL